MKQPQPLPADYIYPPAKAVRVALQEFERLAQADQRVTWGVDALDTYLIPQRPGDLVTILARPSHGKTSLLLHLARHAARSWIKASGGVVVYATWETLVEETIANLAAPLSGFSLEDIGRGKANLIKVRDAALGLITSGVYIFGRSMETPKGKPATLNDLDAALSQLADQGTPAKLVLVDFLQVIGVNGAENDQVEDSTRRMVEANTYRCKDLALTHRCSLTLAAQAGRQVDSYQGLKFASMADGKWASVIEECSDKVLASTRPILYLQEGSTLKREGWSYTVDQAMLCVRIVKQRFGPVGKTFVLDFDPRTCSLGAGEVVGELV